jgi:hypothetical protein
MSKQPPGNGGGAPNNKLLDKAIAKTSYQLSKLSTRSVGKTSVQALDKVIMASECRTTPPCQYCRCSSCWMIEQLSGADSSQFDGAVQLHGMEPSGSCDRPGSARYMP